MYIYIHIIYLCKLSRKENLDLDKEQQLCARICQEDFYQKYEEKIKVKWIQNLCKDRVLTSKCLV